MFMKNHKSKNLKMRQPSIREYIFSLLLFSFGVIFGTVIAVHYDIKNHFYKVSKEDREDLTWRLGAFVIDTDQIIKQILQNDLSAARHYWIASIDNKLDEIEAVFSVGDVTQQECAALIYLQHEIFNLMERVQASQGIALEATGNLRKMTEDCAGSEGISPFTSR